MTVLFLQRVGDPNGNLVSPQLRAIKFGTGFTVTPHPDDALTGVNGDGQLTGYYQIDNAGARTSIATITTTDNSTLFDFFAFTVSTGFKVTVLVHLDGTCTAGAQNGKTLTAEQYTVYKNASGTPAALSVTTPSSGSLMVADEAGGALGGILAASVVGTTVTLRVRGNSASTVKWSGWAELTISPLT